MFKTTDILNKNTDRKAETDKQTEGETDRLIQVYPQKHLFVGL